MPVSSPSPPKKRQKRKEKISEKREKKHFQFPTSHLLRLVSSRTKLVKTSVKRREREPGSRVRVSMPHLVRDRLFFGNIGDAAAVLSGGSGACEAITHVLSLLSSASISFFSEWRPGMSIPTEEIEQVHVAGGESPKRSLAPDKLLYSKERAGPDLKLVRMAMPLKDTEDEDLLDYLDVCLDFIEEGRRGGSVLVHCFAGVSRRFVHFDLVHSNCLLMCFYIKVYWNLSIWSIILQCGSYHGLSYENRAQIIGRSKWLIVS